MYQVTKSWTWFARVERGPRARDRVSFSRYLSTVHSASPLLCRAFGDKLQAVVLDVGFVSLSLSQSLNESQSQDLTLWTLWTLWTRLVCSVLLSQFVSNERKQEAVGRIDHTRQDKTRLDSSSVAST